MAKVDPHLLAEEKRLAISHRALQQQGLIDEAREIMKELIAVQYEIDIQRGIVHEKK